MTALRRQLGLELGAPEGALALSLVPLRSLIGQPARAARLLARLVERPAGLAAGRVGLVVPGPRRRQRLLRFLQVSLRALLGLLSLAQARGKLLSLRACRQGRVGSLPRKPPHFPGDAV